MPGALADAWDEVDGVRIHALVSASAPSDAPAIVFVHGLGVSTRYLEPTMALLAPAYRVAGLDLPGFGRTRASRTFSIRELAHALARWLDVRGIGPAVFVGNSFGCQVIVELAVREPHRTLGLVLNAPTMDPAHRSAWTMIWRVARDVPHEPLSLAFIVARDYLRAGPGRVIRTLRLALRDRIEEKLPRVGVPVMVVCGAHDPVVTARWCDDVAQLTGRERPGAAGATVRTVHDAAHALPYDDPEAFAPLIREMAERVRDA